MTITMMQQSIMCGSCSNELINSYEIRCTKCGKKGHFAGWSGCKKK